MLIVMRHGASEEQIQNVIETVKRRAETRMFQKGICTPVIGAVGANSIDLRDFELLDGVKEVLKISSSYKLVSRILSKKTP